MKKAGFTLIELLAVITVLAIIAVITVAKIGDTIEKSNQGIAKDSAYGYKKAVNDYYYHHLMNKEEINFDGAYMVNSFGELFDSFDIFDIDFDGTAPKDGLLIFDDSELVSGCLSISKYKVEFENGEVSLVSKGNCNVNELQVTMSCDSSYNASPESWFTFDKTTGELKGFSGSYNGTEKNIVIPCSINGTNVSKISARAFSGRDLESVIIPSTVTDIGNSAFEANKLKKIEIPYSVKTIGSNAFSSNELNSVVIPNTVSVIPNGAFSNNKITSLSLPNSVVSIENRAFSDNLISELNFGKNIESIDGWAFYNNRISNLSLPSTIKNIEIAAFNKNNLPDSQAFIYARNNGVVDASTLVSYGGTNKNITIPSTVKVLDTYSLSNNELVSVVLSDNLTTIKDSALYNNLISSVTIKSKVTSIGESAFAYNRLTDITIPSTVKTIGNSAFNNNLIDTDNAFLYARNNGVVDNTKLIGYGGSSKDVTVPSGVTTIGRNAFFSINLDSVILNDDLTTIEESAFAGNKLVSVTIPSSVTSIGDNVFYDNKLLTTIVNAGGNEFVWSKIIEYDGTNTAFAYGTYSTSHGDINIVESGS